MTESIHWVMHHWKQNLADVKITSLTHSNTGSPPEITSWPAIDLCPWSIEQGAAVSSSAYQSFSLGYLLPPLDAALCAEGSSIKTHHSSLLWIRGLPERLLILQWSLSAEVTWGSSINKLRSSRWSDQWQVTESKKANLDLWISNSFSSLLLFHILLD